MVANPVPPLYDSPLSDFIRAGNQGRYPEIYEIENRAIDHEGTLWSALREIAPWAGKSILDLGCGSGYWLPRYSPDAARVVGVEPDPALLPQASARGAEVLHGSAEHIPLPDSSVDVVHARFAYFFPHPQYDCQPGLDEVLRVLKPGGLLVVIDNDHVNGDFAALLGRSPYASTQGEDGYIRQWWGSRGATRTEVLSSWTFDSRENLAAVLGIEFPPELAQAWLAENPDAVELSYGYVLHALVK